MRNIRISLLMGSVAWASMVHGQTKTVAPAKNPEIATTRTPVVAAQETKVPAAPVKAYLIRRDTPVEMMATREISTADVTPGTRFTLRVHAPIKVDGEVVVPVGSNAHGEVLTAVDSGGLGKSGKMTTKLLYIELDDVKIPLEGEQSAKGTGSGSAGAAIVFAGIAGLFHRGNNAKIKAGEMLNGFVAEDVLIDLSGARARIVETDLPTKTLGEEENILDISPDNNSVGDEAAKETGVE